IFLHWVAARLWRRKQYLAALFSGAVGLVALFVAISNSFAGIVSRGDATLAERTKVADAREADKAELARLQAALTALPAYVPTDQTALDATQAAVSTAAA